MSLQDRIKVNNMYAYIFETPLEQIKYLKQALEFDDQSPRAYYNLGGIYFTLNQFDKAIIELEKSLELYNKWGSKPWWIHNYTLLGLAYHKTGQYKKEKEIYKKAEQDFPNDWHTIKCQAILSLSEGDTVAANKYIKKYISVLTEGNPTEADMTGEFALVYSDAGILDKAEEYYYEYLALAPENNDVQCQVAYFLIDKERNIDKGLELTDKALKVNPDNYFYLDCKGWGLYKKGRFEEARDILQRSWDLRRKYGEYDHPAYLHLEAAKKAVARLKN
jgi:tetratricopeptide (TPR) repeat protein